MMRQTYRLILLRAMLTPLTRWAREQGIGWYHPRYAEAYGWHIGQPATMGYDREEFSFYLPGIAYREKGNAYHYRYQPNEVDFI